MRFLGEGRAEVEKPVEEIIPKEGWQDEQGYEWKSELLRLDWSPQSLAINISHPVAQPPGLVNDRPIIFDEKIIKNRLWSTQQQPSRTLTRRNTHTNLEPTTSLRLLSGHSTHLPGQPPRPETTKTNHTPRNRSDPQPKIQIFPHPATASNSPVTAPRTNNDHNPTEHRTIRLWIRRNLKNMLNAQRTQTNSSPLQRINLQPVQTVSSRIRRTKGRVQTHTQRVRSGYATTQNNSTQELPTLLGRVRPTTAQTHQKYTHAPQIPLNIIPSSSRTTAYHQPQLHVSTTTSPKKHFRPPLRTN